MTSSTCMLILGWKWDTGAPHGGTLPGWCGHRPLRSIDLPSNQSPLTHVGEYPHWECVSYDRSILIMSLPSDPQQTPFLIRRYCPHLQALVRNKDVISMVESEAVLWVKEPRFIGEMHALLHHGVITQ